ncbi:MAG: hypothetical protein AAF770_00940 [Bacteroidota bacterium]
MTKTKWPASYENRIHIIALIKVQSHGTYARVSHATSITTSYCSFGSSINT